MAASDKWVNTNGKPLTEREHQIIADNPKVAEGCENFQQFVAKWKESRDKKIRK